MTEYTATDLVKMIRGHYIVNDGVYNRHIILEQVPDGTGMFQNRWIDVVVFQMFPSKGLTRFAFEVKVSRSDFLEELSHPAKHQWCKECFHEFWFVAPKNVIQLAELPPNIGWMYPAGGKLHRARYAIRNDNPKLDDALLAGFMRAAGKAIDSAYHLNKEEIIRNDDNYKQAQEYQEAVHVFCNQRGEFISPREGKDEIVRHLNDATMDKQLKQDRDKLLSITANFQRSILGLLPLFVTIAKRSLLARDELGRYIIDGFGGEDNESIQALKEYIKDKHGFGYEKKLGEIVNLLIGAETLQA